jgi:hypothetical protein
MRVRLLALSALLAAGLALPASASESAEMSMTSCEASSPDAADPVAALPLAAKPGPEPDACSATAYCHNGTVLNCSTGGSGTCQGVDSSCPSQRGYVVCAGSYTYCPACPGNCPPGAPACTSTKQCALTYCGGIGYGVCNNGCCYCY